MEKNFKILSDIITWDKYAKYDKSLGRRESWNELTDRNMIMQMEQYPQLTDDIA
jgi:hypothetical protein